MAVIQQRARFRMDFHSLTLRRKSLVLVLEMITCFSTSVSFPDRCHDRQRSGWRLIRRRNVVLLIRRVNCSCHCRVDHIWCGWDRSTCRSRCQWHGCRRLHVFQPVLDVNRNRRFHRVARIGVDDMSDIGQCHIGRNAYRRRPTSCWGCSPPENEQSKS